MAGIILRKKSASLAPLEVNFGLIITVISLYLKSRHQLKLVKLYGNKPAILLVNHPHLD